MTGKLIVSGMLVGNYRAGSNSRKTVFQIGGIRFYEHINCFNVESETIFKNMII